MLALIWLLGTWGREGSVGEDSSCPSGTDISKDIGGLSPICKGLSPIFDIQDSLELRTPTPRPHRSGDVGRGLEPSLTHLHPPREGRSQSGTGKVHSQLLKLLKLRPHAHIKFTQKNILNICIRAQTKILERDDYLPGCKQWLFWGEFG